MRLALRCSLLFMMALGLAACGSNSEGARANRPITVFAAVSTTEVITEAAARFEKARGVHVVTSFEASSTLAKQIKAGARADVFLSADEQWMDDLGAAGGIKAGTRIDLLGNTLVLIAPKGKGFAVKIERGAKLESSVKRIAVADPAHVPAGRYAKQSLEWLGWWQDVKDRLIPAQDVRAALRLVELGEADAGIVYATDAGATVKVEEVGRFPEDSHEPIRYPIAECKDAGAGAAGFIEFLRSAEMAAVFEGHGFRVLAAH